MQISGISITVGWVIALLVLVLTVVFAAVGRLDLVPAVLIGGLAIARLIP